MRKSTKNRLRVAAVVCVLGTCALAQFGMPYEQPKEPSLYDQATGKARFALFGPWAELKESKVPGHGDTVLYRYHIMDMSKAMQSSSDGKKIDPKKFETQVIDFHYPYADIWNAYKTEGATGKIFAFIKQKNPAAADDIANNRNFVYAKVTKGDGAGIALSLDKGKYRLWSGAPAAFGNDYDLAGMVVKQKKYCLFAMNKNDYSVMVFLSPTHAERHNIGGAVEDITASVGEAVRIYLPQILLIAGAGVVVIALALVAKRFVFKRRTP